ncbi:endonuclease/exonuclease/phosphatase family protein [Uliginosibacterium sp. 31-16]|uniref:endonuclease/exonuclease/phosphatase family protein n=1 Tax=Uliginosibacterium sp. 31-16 TaxID=3068315 RepID=UPI00273CF8FE|nr:endonuclease/exonuclease/phosphatase family protein [Uliginosibacterium sp. 31-16]MDP5238189.1 endonuclease/exonuclease/phosphatase family protein [Uliginosibacterium sp. 31-16]
MHTLRIASYNVQNLFARPAALSADNSSEVLREGAELAALLDHPRYDGPVGERILKLVRKYSLHRRDAEHPWFELNEIRGGLLAQKDGRLFGLRAKGNADWVGWLQWKQAPVEELGVRNTARVIGELRADVLALTEVESRPTLQHFNQGAIAEFLPPYPYQMCIDGNDARGIDVAMLSRLPLVSMRTHIFDSFTSPRTGLPHAIFARDCPEYELALPNGQSLWLLVNHFKSQGPGRPSDPAPEDEWRRVQAERVAAILDRFDLHKDWVVVAGDLNEDPSRGNLSALLNKPGLTDVLTTDKAPAETWTHRFRDERSRLDYLLVSEPLRTRLQATGIERRGIFSPSGRQDERFPEVTDRATQASDHAGIWAEFDLK